jgi:hypothetical protein
MADIPSSSGRIQIEATQFRKPVSENLLQSLGGGVNYILDNLMPVGTLVHSMLTEAQYQAQASTNWILADGRNVAGSLYASVTGSSTVPDARGIYIRGKNNSRAAGTGNSAGELGLGTYEADKNKQHLHQLHEDSFRLRTEGGGPPGAGPIRDYFETDNGKDWNNRIMNESPVYYTQNDGGSEASPRTITANIFIKIN